jgi:hypothetical protein
LGQRANAHQAERVAESKKLAQQLKESSATGKARKRGKGRVHPKSLK